MFKEGVIVFIEVQETDKAPDLRYFSIGSSDIDNSDDYYERKAIEYFHTEINNTNVTLLSKGVHRCSSLQEYMSILTNQLS